MFRRSTEPLLTPNISYHILPSMQNKLHRSEWVLIFSLLAIMVSFVLVGKINAHRANISMKRLPPSGKEVIVKINGAVKKPGEYLVLEGTPVEEVLLQASLKRNANIRKVPLKKLVELPCEIYIEELEEITVYVEGEIGEAKELLLPVDSRICDVKSKILVLKTTDKSFFKSKKRLVDGAVVQVPKKTVE